MHAHLSSTEDRTLQNARDLVLQKCKTCGGVYPKDYVVCPRDATPLGVDQDLEDPLLGTIIMGTYRIVRCAAKGGMGRLYEAQHTRLDRHFAIKVLHESHARAPDAVARFNREARILSRIHSPHVLGIVDVVRTIDDRKAIVTEYLLGEDLRLRLGRRGTMTPTEAIPIIRQLCRGLAAAHANGIIHRDLKPSNLFLESGADGRIMLKILDFGVAKLEGESDLTRTGAIVGTPAYMAPEQATGSANVDVRADVYATAAVLYRMLTGHPPYSGNDATRMLADLLQNSPRRPRSLNPDIPSGLETIIQRSMARDPNERPSDILELEAELAVFDQTDDRNASRRLLESAHSPGDVDTLVLPRGSVARAEDLTRKAQRARPLALLATFGGVLVCTAIGALLAVGLQAYGSSVAERTTAEIHGAWMFTFVIFATSFGIAARAMRNRWQNSPAIERYSRALTQSLLVTATLFGAGELSVRAIDVLEASSELSASALLVRAFALAAIFGGVTAWHLKKRQAN